MNSKSTFVILLVCGLFLAAVLARNGGMLLLSLPFLVYFTIGMLRCPDHMDLRAQRTANPRDVTAGEPFQVEVVVENQGKNLANLTLSDPAWPGMAVVGGELQQRTTLAGGQKTQLQYTARGARGLYRWSTICAKASDPCDLFSLTSEIPAFAEVRARPATMRLRRVRIAPRSTLHAPGPMPAHLPGPGTDFWQVREYKAGDPLRRLNWRLAGRYPRRLFTNEYEGEEIADYGLILDTRRVANDREVDETLFEASISAAASLAESFLNQGNRLALLVFGEAPVCLFPGYGKRQLNRLRQALAHASLSRNLPARYLESFPARLFPNRSVLLMFSVVDTGDLETYRRLRSFGYEVLLVSPDPIEYASRKLESSPLNDLAIRAARLERIVQLNALIRIGISVIDWQVDRPLDTLLRRTARELARRRNL